MHTALHQAGHLPFSCLLWALGISVVPVSGAFSLEATLIPPTLASRQGVALRPGKSPLWATLSSCASLGETQGLRS